MCKALHEEQIYGYLLKTDQICHIRQILLASGSVRVTTASGAAAQATLQAEDLGSAIFSIIASTVGASSATCAPATCAADFDGGALRSTRSLRKSATGRSVSYSSAFPIASRRINALTRVQCSLVVPALIDRPGRGNRLSRKLYAALLFARTRFMRS